MTDLTNALELILDHERGLTGFICNLYGLDKDALRTAYIGFRLEEYEAKINSLTNNVVYVDFCHAEIK